MHPRSQSVTSLASFNLLRDAWLPVRRRSGATEWIRPHEITDNIDADPFVAFDWPRPEFNGASHEFLIGLLATAAPPTGPADWNALWVTPPAPAALEAAFAPFGEAFNFTGSGPRFMQEHGPIETGAVKSVDVLLVNTPGDQSIKDNKDFFVKEARGTAFSLRAAAIALYTLQTYSPSGGRGHLTSIRGGGPLTTLLITTHPQFGDTLWGRIWPNVPDGDRQESEALDDKFPWLKPTRSSEKGKTRLSPENTLPLQVHWWMPRRIRLNIEDGPARCGLLDEACAEQVRTYHTLQYGMKAADGVFEHPLSPYVAQKQGAPKGAVHASPARVGYSSWPGLVVVSENRLRTPAQCIRRWGTRRAGLDVDCRFTAFGFQMDNAKALGWIESEEPLWPGFGGEGHEEITELIGYLASGAFLAANETARRVKDGLFANPGEVKADLESLRQTFYRETYPGFRHLVTAASSIVVSPEEEEDDRLLPLRRQWAGSLAQAGLTLFDRQVPVLTTGAGDVERRIKARFDLSGFLLGRSKPGRKQFFEGALHVPAPTFDQKKSSAARSDS